MATDFVHASETKRGEVTHVCEDANGPEKPGRARFDHYNLSVARALWITMKVVISAVAVAVVRKVLDAWIR